MTIASRTAESMASSAAQVCVGLDAPGAVAPRCRRRGEEGQSQGDPALRRTAEAITGKHTWRNPNAWDARVLGALAKWGYQPSEVESLLLATNQTDDQTVAV